MADPVTVSTPASQSAIAAGANAVAQKVVSSAKADVKAVGARRPWVLVACSMAAGAIVAELAGHYLHVSF